MNEEQLIELKNKVEKAKLELAELKGSKKHLTKRSEDDWNCNSLTQANKKLQEFNNSITKLDKQIDEGIKELEEEYISYE